jgi:pilus assembly protein Flp/PilA
MRRQVRGFVAAAADRGASAVEYALLVAAIAAVIIVAAFGIGTLVREQYQDTCYEIELRNPDTVNSSVDC